MIALLLLIIFIVYRFYIHVKIETKCEKEIKKIHNIPESTPLPNDFKIVKSLLYELKFSKSQNSKHLFGLVLQQYNANEKLIGALLLAFFIFFRDNFMFYSDIN